MADKNIGSLPLAPQLDDDSLLVAEQQGQAMKVTGAQFKEFGKQAVMSSVQELVDTAEDAADRAVEAVSAVTEMTVSAQTLENGQEAAVTKSMQNGKVNLLFGLPRGEQGKQGKEGKTGPRGPQGLPGTGLKILGYYDTLDDLKAAQPDPEIGDAYGVGTVPPYSIFIFDGVSMDWKDTGQLSAGGGGGEVLPEDVVTSVGGASLEYGDGVGDAPHVITFDLSEEPPITAEDVQFSESQSVKEAIDGLKSSVSDGKKRIASAVTDKGVPTAQDASFVQMAENIRQITTGSDTSDATATPGDILAPKTAYTSTGKVTGIIPSIGPQTITPGTANKTIANGQYLSGTQTIQGDPNLSSNNIRKGVSIFGVNGAMESTFQAVLTVTADTGAVVTATHTDGTEVSELSVNGQVVLDLPIEGTWKVTAVRGVAQYNTVTIQVTSHYTATLTAALHVVYFGKLSGSTSGQNKGTVSIPGYALVAGGGLGHSTTYLKSVRGYNQNLVQQSAPNMQTERSHLTGASVGNYGIFAGGGRGINSTPEYSNCDAYDTSLTKVTVERINAAFDYVGTSIGDYALFGGARASGGSRYATVFSFSSSLVKNQLELGLVSSGDGSAASNQKYAMFCTGSKVTAYDKNLTRTIAVNVSSENIYPKAAQAGNYVVFSSANASDAYDLFLTRTGLPDFPGFFGYGTTLNEFAVFAGFTYPGPIGSAAVYDPYLSLTRPETFSGKYMSGLAHVGKYAVIFGSGVEYEGGQDEAYEYV